MGYVSTNMATRKTAYKKMGRELGKGGGVTSCEELRMEWLAWRQLYEGHIDKLLISQQNAEKRHMASEEKLGDIVNKGLYSFIATCLVMVSIFVSVIIYINSEQSATDTGQDDQILAIRNLLYEQQVINTRSSALLESTISESRETRVRIESEINNVENKGSMSRSQILDSLREHRNKRGH